MGHRFIINDTYRSDIPLIHPPHLIAMTALFLALSQQFSSKVESTGNTNAMDSNQPNQSGSTDIVGFLAGLNVSMTAVSNVAQDIIALYTIWDKYRDADDPVPDTSTSASNGINMFSGSARGGFPINTQFTSRRGGASPLAGTPLSPMKKSTPGTPMSPPVAAPSKDNVMTQVHVAIILKEMRQFRFQSLFPPARHVGGPSTPQSSHSVSHNMQYGMSFPSGRWPAVAVNKQLERTQHMG
jgi:cyclin C